MGAKLLRVKVFASSPLSPSPQMWRGGTTDSPFVPPLRMAKRGTGGEDRRERGFKGGGRGQARGCHPERARGTRASEGPACGRPSRKAGPSHPWESRSSLDAEVTLTAG